MKYWLVVSAEHTFVVCFASRTITTMVQYTTKIAHRPEPIVIDIIGIEEGSRGLSCEEHNFCGMVMEEDVVVCLRKVQVLGDGKEETAIAVYWVTDGEERCHVGFLHHHMVAYALHYDGTLAQVTRVLGPNTGVFDTTEHQLYHKNTGYCFAMWFLQP